VSTGGWIESSPAVANGVVYVGSDDDNLYAVDAITGSPLWQGATSGYLHSSPAVADGAVFIGSLDRYLYAFNLDAQFYGAPTRAPAGPPDPAHLVPDYSLEPQK
jgi:outer membrane protein assembly factor BamB